MTETHERAAITARDIRNPRTLQEAEAALRVVRMHLRSVEADLAAKCPEDFDSDDDYIRWQARAERARHSWETKLADVEYLTTRIELDGDPERMELIAKCGALRNELHRTWARCKQLVDDGDDAGLRTYITQRALQLPVAFYEEFLSSFPAAVSP